MASQTKTGKNERRNSLDLGVLAALGFGPEAALLHEPKLLVDLRFLSTLLAEFEQELGREDAGAAFFQIGLMMGLRDACRAVDSAQPAAMRLAIDLGPLANEGGLAFSGTWPERFEA
ncbi:MAG: hypothetical protein O7A09_08700, partial [Proteobacteria bacterium]|nr:hypothetical protein [Pseudomonadota bacterium]